jgi:predicted GTPase
MACPLPWHARPLLLPPRPPPCERTLARIPHHAGHHRSPTRPPAHPPTHRPALDPLLLQASRSERLVVGLIGYPNVGKSSTINALFGEKKTAVAATPGKTKHFQTLNVSEGLCLCDCPGLVLPQYAHSKAEMVAAGERRG